MQPHDSNNNTHLTGTSLLLLPESYSNSNTEMSQKHSSTDIVSGINISPAQLNGTVHTEGNQLEVYFFVCSQIPLQNYISLQVVKPTYLNPEQSQALKMNQ